MLADSGKSQGGNLNQILGDLPTNIARLVLQMHARVFFLKQLLITSLPWILADREDPYTVFSEAILNFYQHYCCVHHGAHMIRRNNDTGLLTEHIHVCNYYYYRGNLTLQRIGSHVENRQMLSWNY